MKIVQPYARIVTPLDQTALSSIEYAARISHRSEDGQTDETWRRFIKAVVIDHGDWSVVEHVTVSVEFLVDRGITHELVRHRLFSFTQESTRFVNYEKKMPPSFIYPLPDVMCPKCVEGDEPKYIVDSWMHSYTGPSCGLNHVWLEGIEEAERSYKSLLKAGWRPQEARSVLPNAIASKILMTGNLRNFRHFFLMRTTKEAHPQMRQVTIPLLAEFQSRVPLLFDDIAPNARQADNIAKGR